MRALAEEVEVDVAQGGQEAVGVAALPGLSVGEVEAQAVAQRQRRPGKEGLEEPARGLLHLDGARRAVRGADQAGGRPRIGMKRAHQHARTTRARRRMGAEHVVRRDGAAGEEFGDTPRLVARAGRTWRRIGPRHQGNRAGGGRRSVYSSSVRQ